MVEEHEITAPEDSLHGAPAVEAVEASASTSSVVDASASVDPTSNTPSVDELQGRLADLQGAMDQLQSGDLDAAEETISALEQSMATAQDATP